VQARVCVQNYDNGDLQGFLYLDDGTGESLATTTARFTAGSAQAKNFNVSGTKGNITARADVDVENRTVDFSIDFTDMSGTTTSIYSRALTVSSASC
jgi:uncharacterized protein YhdP